MWPFASPKTSLRQQKYADWFRCLDRTGDGSVDRDDFEAIVLTMTSALGWGAAASESRALRAAYMDLFDALSAHLDEDGDGKIDLDEFVGFYSSLAADVERTGTVPRWALAQLRCLLESLDTDGDGAISVEEFGTYLRAVGSDAAAETAFRLLDENGDGLVSLTELETRFREWLTSDDPSRPGNVLMTGRLPE